jgi:hypothetical protein
MDKHSKLVGTRLNAMENYSRYNNSHVVTTSSNPTNIRSSKKTSSGTLTLPEQLHFTQQHATGPNTQSEIRLN